MITNELRVSKLGKVRPRSRALLIVLAGCCLFAATLLAGQTDDVKNGHFMEFFGMGPELWADRAKAWVEAISLVLDVLIAKIGVLGLAAIAVWQNLRARALVDEAKQELNGRMDRVSGRADKAVAVAGAAAQAAGADPARVVAAGEAPDQRAVL